MPEYRKVCKRWKNGLDNFYTNHLSLEPFNESEHRYKTTTPYYSIPDDDYHVILYGIRGINLNVHLADSIIFKIDSIRGNKIEFEFLRVDPQDERYDELCVQFFDSICALLKKVGKHVFHVEIWAPAMTIKCQILYGGMQRCLQLLPRLRGLMILANIEVECNTDENFIPNLIDAYPLPELLQFRVFDFRINGLPLALEHHIFNVYGSSIQKVAFTPVFHLDLDTFAHLPNLSELVLHRLNDLELLFNTLRGMVQMGIRLQKFVGETSVDCNIIDIFNELRPFDIREVRLRRIDIDSGSLEENGENFEPIVSLHTLEVEDSPYLSYTFLSKLPNLEFLYIRGRIQYEDTGYPFEPIVRFEVNSHLHDCMYFCIPPPFAFWKAYPLLREIYIMDEDIEYARRANMIYRFPRLR